MLVSPLVIEVISSNRRAHGHCRDHSEGWPPGRALGFLVEAVLEDRLDTPVAKGVVQGQSPLAGGIEPLIAVGVAKAHDS